MSGRLPRSRWASHAGCAVTCPPRSDTQSNLPTTALLPATSIAKRAEVWCEISARKVSGVCGATGTRNLTCGHPRTPYPLSCKQCLHQFEQHDARDDGMPRKMPGKRRMVAGNHRRTGQRLDAIGVRWCNCVHGERQQRAQLADGNLPLPSRGSECARISGRGMNAGSILPASVLRISCFGASWRDDDGREPGRIRGWQEHRAVHHAGSARSSRFNACSDARLPAIFTMSSSRPRISNLPLAGKVGEFRQQPVGKRQCLRQMSSGDLRCACRRSPEDEARRRQEVARLGGTPRGQDSSFGAPEDFVDGDLPVAFDRPREIRIERHRCGDDARHMRQRAQFAMECPQLQRRRHQPDRRRPARSGLVRRVRQVGRIDGARVEKWRSGLQCEHHGGLESEHVLRRNRTQDGRAARRCAE